MTLKKIRIKLKSVDEALDDAINTMKTIQSGQNPMKRQGEYFESLDAVRSVLTEKRLALLRMIRERTPKSIAELSRLIKRDFKSVHGDVEILRELGLVKVKVSRQGVASHLTANATEIVLRIAV